MYQGFDEAIVSCTALISAYEDLILIQLLSCRRRSSVFNFQTYYCCVRHSERPHNKLASRQILWKLKHFNNRIGSTCKNDFASSKALALVNTKEGQEVTKLFWIKLFCTLFGSFFSLRELSTSSKVFEHRFQIMNRENSQVLLSFPPKKWLS